MAKMGVTVLNTMRAIWTADRESIIEVAWGVEDLRETVCASLACETEHRLLGAGNRPAILWMRDNWPEVERFANQTVDPVIDIDN